MKRTTVWREITKIEQEKRRKYFHWKNGIDNVKIQYSEMNEEEFLENLGVGDQWMAFAKRWESSPEYKRLLCLLKEDDFITDLLEIYEEIKVKAKDGDSQAIKNLIMLQGEIQKYRKSIDEYNKVNTEKEEEENIDDGLVI